MIMMKSDSTLSRPRLALATALVWSLFLSVLPGQLWGESIFDDNWSPPVPVKVRPPAEPVTPPPAATKPPADPDPNKPDTGADTPPVARPAVPSAEVAPPIKASALPKRVAIPSRAEQTKTRKLFKEVFAAELAQKAVAPRRALATKLLDEAAAVKDAVTDRYVLLVGAAQAAKEASNLTLYCRAADALAESYDIDGLRMKSDAAISMKLRADTPAAADENCVAGLKLADQLVKADDFTTASRVLSAVRQTPPRGPLVAAVQERSRSVDALRASTERVAPFLKKLWVTPDDADANLMVGQYYCFDRGDWKKGLPLLAKGGASSLPTIAARDLASGSDATKYAGMGDAWWALAEAEKPPRQLAIRQRATRFYSLAINCGTAVGLKRTLFEKRIAETPQPVTGDARIVSARWGGGANWANVTARMTELVAGGGPIWANPGTLNADPTPGWRKHLEISYIKYGITKSISVDEDQQVPMADFGP